MIDDDAWGVITNQTDAFTPLEQMDHHGDPIVAAPMSAAPFVYRDDGQPDWGTMWQGFCELALYGGPPHRAAEDALHMPVATSAAVAEDTMQLAEFLTTHAPALTARILEQFAPLYTPTGEARGALRIPQLKRPLFDAQIDTVAAVACANGAGASLPRRPVRMRPEDRVGDFHHRARGTHGNRPPTRLGHPRHEPIAPIDRRTDALRLPRRHRLGRLLPRLRRRRDRHPD